MLAAMRFWMQAPIVVCEADDALAMRRYEVEPMTRPKSEAER